MYKPAISWPSKSVIFLLLIKSYHILLIWVNIFTLKIHFNLIFTIQKGRQLLLTLFHDGVNSIQTLFSTLEEDAPWHNNGRKDDSMLHTTIRKIRATEQAAFLYFSEWAKSILYYSAKLWVLTWTVIYKTSSVQPCKCLMVSYLIVR